MSDRVTWKIAPHRLLKMVGNQRGSVFWARHSPIRNESHGIVGPFQPRTHTTAPCGANGAHGALPDLNASLSLSAGGVRRKIEVVSRFELDCRFFYFLRARVGG